MTLPKHVCEGDITDAVVNYCGHARRIVLRVSPDTKLYMRWLPTWSHLRRQTGRPFAFYVLRRAA